LLARLTAMKALLPAGADTTQYGGFATAFFMLGAATGGIVFGILGDRWGRAKTLFTTVICYSLFTGLSAMSLTWIDFSAYRFLTGMGVGGTFAAAVSLVSETLPARSRPNALAALQATGAVGNMLAAIVTMFVQPGLSIGGVAGWRIIFVIGIAPSLLVLLVMRKLREPDAWTQARLQRAANPAQHLGSVNELFGDPRWRRNALVGMALGMAGIMGLWGVSFWLPELIKASLKGSVGENQLGLYVSYGMLLFNFAAAVGTYLFGLMMGWIGRKPTFALGFVAAIASIICVFGFMTTAQQVWWMAPLLGFCTLSILGGYSVYFPELFPLRLRATGVGFCYNTARYISAVAPFAIGMLTASLKAPESTERGAAGLSNLTLLSSLGGADNAIRYAAIIVAAVYLIGLVALPFATETRGKPLPE
ncbi:MAG TPA: MFS transporter, partial [Phycisphaerae bacterium]|nr:MFS transporter [Phycisphaerae bacterium]